MNLTQYIYKYYRRRYYHPASIFPDINKVQTVLLLYDSDLQEKNLHIKQLQKELQKKGKTVVAWGFCPKKNITTSILPMFRIIGSKDINIFQKPKQHILNDLTAQHFDLTINLSTNHTMPLKYLNLLAHTTFRAAATQEDADLQIMLTPEQDSTYLFDQIMFYLNNIKSND